jgi:FAD:protein FMN transferase
MTSGGFRNLVTVARRAMACEFSVTFSATERNGVAAGCAALDEVERMEEKLSVYRRDSDVSRINREASDAPVRVGSELLEVLGSAVQIGSATDGAFDAAAGALVRAWGFYQGPKRVPSREEWRWAMERTGMQHVALNCKTGTVRILRPGVEINLGAIGKGYAIDAAVKRLRSGFGVRSALIEGGGSSVYAAGSPPGEPGWTVAIGDPFRKGARLSTVVLRDRALGTSGAAFQYFEQGGRRYGHVLDPRTGWPACRCASATVLAPTAAEADALSTAFFVLGVDGAGEYCSRRRDVAAVIVTMPREGTPPRIVSFNLSEKELKVA